MEQWPPVWLIPAVIYCHIWGVISLDNQEGSPAFPCHAASTPLFFPGYLLLFFQVTTEFQELKHLHLTLERKVSGLTFVLCMCVSASVSQAIIKSINNLTQKLTNLASSVGYFWLTDLAPTEFCEIWFWASRRSREYKMKQRRRKKNSSCSLLVSPRAAATV